MASAGGAKGIERSVCRSGIVCSSWVTTWLVVRREAFARDSLASETFNIFPFISHHQKENLPSNGTNSHQRHSAPSQKLATENIPLRNIASDSIALNKTMMSALVWGEIRVKVNVSSHFDWWLSDFNDNELCALSQHQTTNRSENFPPEKNIENLKLVNRELWCCWWMSSRERV